MICTAGASPHCGEVRGIGGQDHGAARRLDGHDLQPRGVAAHANGRESPQDVLVPSTMRMRFAIVSVTQPARALTLADPPKAGIDRTPRPERHLLPLDPELGAREEAVTGSGS